MVQSSYIQKSSNAMFGEHLNHGFNKFYTHGFLIGTVQQSGTHHRFKKKTKHKTKQVWFRRLEAVIISVREGEHLKTQLCSVHCPVRVNYRQYASSRLFWCCNHLSVTPALPAGTRLHRHVGVDLQNNVFGLVQEQDTEGGHFLRHTAGLRDAWDDPDCLHDALDSCMVGRANNLQIKTD